MQFLTSLFGGMGNTLITAGLALGVVLVLILLGLWGLKWLSTAFSRSGPVRQRRLTLIDTLPIDAKRKILIVRRDDVEHLILTGGPADVVVESRIPAAPPAARPAPARQPASKTVPERHRTAPRTPPQARPTRERAAPVRPTADRSEQDARVASLDRLRETASGQRRFPSLRHTGLLRPVSRRDEPSPAGPGDNPPHDRSDSAKQAENADRGSQADYDFDDSATYQAKGRVADGR